MNNTYLTSDEILSLQHVMDDVRKYIYGDLSPRERYTIAYRLFRATKRYKDTTIVIARIIGEQYDMFNRDYNMSIHALNSVVGIGNKLGWSKRQIIAMYEIAHNRK